MKFDKSNFVQREQLEELKGTLLILVWVFLLVGVVFAFFVGQIIITIASGMTVMLIALWKYIKIMYG